MLARLALHGLHRLGSFLNCLSWKNNCSPAVNTKSAPQSTHFKTLSWNSMEELPSAHNQSAADSLAPWRPTHSWSRGPPRCRKGRRTHSHTDPDALPRARSLLKIPTYMKCVLHQADPEAL